MSKSYVYCFDIASNVPKPCVPVGILSGETLSTNPARLLKGQKTRKALPIILRRGTAPKNLLSLLKRELSPSMK